MLIKCKVANWPRCDGANTEKNYRNFLNNNLFTEKQTTVSMFKSIINRKEYLQNVQHISQWGWTLTRLSPKRQWNLTWCSDAYIVQTPHFHCFEYMDGQESKEFLALRYSGLVKIANFDSIAVPSIFCWAEFHSWFCSIKQKSANFTFSVRFLFRQKVQKRSKERVKTDGVEK